MRRPAPWAQEWKLSTLPRTDSGAAEPLEVIDADLTRVTDRIKAMIEGLSA